MEFDGQKIIQVDIDEEMKKSYLDYSMSVIVGRALPDVRDGLKPVHRRILYTMYEKGLTPDKAHHKCADTVGAVLGAYHPHGDASVYDALVRLAQDFSMRYMLVDGHGNFGSVDGDPPAAYRYTEARMSKISMHMLTDIDKETVNFIPNFDDRLKEPSVLPSKFPNLLVNGSTGIAVGMATNIPPHNLEEVVSGICHLIDNPDAQLPELMEYIKGPDFPTGGIIMGKKGIRAAYGTGRGKIILRARADIVEKKNGRFKIVVSELPFQVNKAKLIENIANLVKNKRIEGIVDVNDYSGRHGMEMVIDLKKDANPQVVLNQLFSYTQMQITYGVIMLALVNGVPKILTLKQMMEEYIKFQCQVITRRTEFDLRKAKERAHILEGLKIALDFVDEVIAILRKSKSVQEGKTRLMERFGFDEIQAQAIVQMRLGQLTGMERTKIEEELATLTAKIAEMEEILQDHQRILEILKTELIAIRDKFRDDRRTEILSISGEVDIEDLIPQEECVLTLTSLGYIKRQPVDAYHIQRRGGRGVIGMTRREEDIAETMFTCSSHDYVLLFTNFGRVYRVKAYEIPEGSRTSKGINIVNLLPVSSDEKVTAMIRVSKFEEDKYLCMVTRNGIIKRTNLTAYDTTRKGGVIAILLDDGDELAWVKMTSGENDLIVATRKGMSIRFHETDARVLGRTARGVRAISLLEGDYVVGMAVPREDATLLTVSEKGLGRRSDLSDYRVQNRGGKGLINYRTEKYGEVATIRVVDDRDDVIIIASDGVIIRIPVSDISIFSRPSKGVIVMKPNEGERVVTFSTTEHQSEEEDSENETASIEQPLSEEGQQQAAEILEEILEKNPEDNV